MVEPYAWTLVEFFEILDRERLEALGDRLREIERARLVALAMHTPKELAVEKEMAMRNLLSVKAKTSERDQIAQMGRAIRRAERRRGH